MLARTKTRLINPKNRKRAAVLYFNYGNRLYAIPKKIAEKYVVKSTEPVAQLETSVSSEEVFGDLVKKFTKAGALLKGLRAREGLTQEKFAKKIQVTQANLSNMEHGRRPVGKQIAKRIEKIFKVNYRYFLN